MVPPTRIPAAFLALSLALMGSSCQIPSATTQPIPPGVTRGADGSLSYDTVAPSGPRDTISFWDGSAGDGPPRIHLSRAEQTAYFFRGSHLVGKSWLSTGDASHQTPAGKFTILQKNKWHKSSRYGAAVDSAGNVVVAELDKKKDPLPPGTQYEGAKVTNFMRLTWDGVGMHAGFLPGYPASHGCIRMPMQMSEHFFNAVELGTPVTVD